MPKIGIEIQNVIRTLLAFGLLLTSPAFAAAGCEALEAAETLPLPGRWRGNTFDAAQWLRFEVGSPAVVTLDATVPLTAPVEPVLTVLDSDCDDDGDAFVYLERGATHQVLFVRSPGVYLLRLASQDPAFPLPAYKLTAGLDDLTRPPGSLDKDTEPEPWEIDPDDFAASGGPGGERRMICFKDTEPEPWEIDPDDFADCRPEIDDHADTVGCGTWLRPGREVGGEIGNGWGDDADVFRFTVREPRIVRIESHGGADTLGALYDRDGHRLALDADGGGVRLVRALGPGRYTVRLEGLRAAEGPYTLSLETLDW